MADNDLDLLDNPASPAAVPPPVFNAADYMADLADLDITEAQKVEFLQTLWWIMGAMVKMNFGVDSLIPAFQDALTRTQNTLEQANPSPEFNIAASEDDAEKES